MALKNKQDNQPILEGDDISPYTQQDESLKQKMLSKIVSFQGENETVGRLVGTKAEAVLDSLEELLRPEGGKIIIPSFDSSRFEKSIYIERRVKFAFGKSCNLHGRFIADLAKRLKCTVENLNRECRISSQGQIEWFVDDKRRKQIWEKIKQMNDQTSGKIEEDSHIIQLDEELDQQPVVIICGLAGAGKSTLLSHYYSEIKKKKPDCWVIRLNLAEHCDVILKLDSSRPDLIAFLINHLHVINPKCPFSRSLLNHRLERGEQIVFMFDGYDEIDEKCQEIAVKLMKFIQEKKSIPLFVTTRSHLAHHLQYELCQLAYYLEKFDVKDQIDYLTSYWTNEPPPLKAGPIRDFAVALVDRVSETLKDEERAFIGIPLQCRILAECYQKNVGDIMESNAVNNVTFQSDELVSQKLLNLLDDKKFDLISLYSKLMDTKRNIFLEGKSKTGPNLNVAVDMNNTIKTIEFRLTKLAVETIIPEPSILEMFRLTKYRHKSSHDVAQEEKNLAINCLKYGLTFSSGDVMRPKFLHRTFAEYLVAKYLYEGFHPDEERYNKLLENESIRKLILNKILASEQYDGVQMFLDGMVKTLVDEDEEWRRLIVCHQLPDRLKKLSKSLFTQLLPDYTPYWAFDRMRMHRPEFTIALHFSLSNRKGNIFLLLCDCLDATFHRRQVRWAMCTIFKSPFPFILDTVFEESRIFKRFINYFDIYPNDPAMYCVIYTLIGGMVPYNSADFIEKSSIGNRCGRQQTMNDILKFLENQHIAFDKYLCRNNQRIIQGILEFLICHDNYRSHLERFLQFLSKSKAYSDDSKLTGLLIQVFQSKDQRVTGRIAETLEILQELGRSAVLAKLYIVLLFKEPEAFQNVYQPCRLEKDEGSQIDRNRLLERDSYGMSLLHGAAFYGDVDIVGQILARFSRPFLHIRAKEAIRKVVLEGFTPFYFAAAKNHEEVCSKLLVFVKDFFPDALTELTKLNTFIHWSLDHAMKSENAEMFQLISKVVKKELGRDYLLDLFTTTHPFPCIFYDGCRSYKLFNAMAKTIVDRDGVVDYKCLHDLIFYNNGIETNALRCINAEHLQGLLSVEGAGPFTKRLLTDNLLKNFEVLSNLLKNFNETQLLDFVEVITFTGDTEIVRSKLTYMFHVDGDPAGSNRSKRLLLKYAFDDLIFTSGNGIRIVHGRQIVPKNSLWGDFLQSTSIGITDGDLSTKDSQCIFECLTCVSDILGDDYVKELLLLQDDYGYVVRHLSQDIVKRMLNYLPEKSQEEIKMEWKENAPPVTHDSFVVYCCMFDENLWQVVIHNCDVLRFYLDYGSHVQLFECVDILTSTYHPFNWHDGPHSVWSDIVESCNETVTNEILKSVSGICGWEAVKMLLIHDIDGLPFILKAVSWGDDIDGRLDMLPQEIRKDVEQVIERKAAEFIDLVFRDHKTYFIASIGRCYKRLNILIFLINYSNAQQLEQLVENITKLQVSAQSEETLSIWAEMLTYRCDEAETNDVEKMNTFLKCVSEKLDTDAVKKLVLYKIKDKPVIYYPALRGEEKMVEVMLAHLDAKNRKKIQRQVNEFINQYFQAPSYGVITNAMKAAFDNLLSRF
ncbi:uncharacterized protein LOC130694258 [Daphnia carinata]|uniref:uncharacterized protein LOC130694258 n=1 Tax=Daphnia carinata TaxID=120202 RepID=UPI00257BBE8D|nr:uncharacterized protein LOC130694258 [Daphnia carinata]